MPYRLDLVDPHPAAGERLIELGALDVDITERHVAAVMPDAVTAHEVTAVLGVSAEDLSLSPAQGRDDDSVWVLQLRAVQAGRWRLVPVARAAPASPHTIQLLDRAAFGTGLHPTTALCLELIDGLIGDDPPSRALDVGIGSGVLALAALDAGVPEVLGIDIDPAALHTAAENAQLNGVEPRLRLALGGPESVEEAWPLILANVLAAPLIEMAPLLVRRLSTRGQLILSGIPEGVAGEVDAAYRRLGLKHLESRSRAGWTALRLIASW